MKKVFQPNLRLIEFVRALLLVAGLSGAAFGATFTVTKTADTNDGACDADCSLREAIITANNSPADDAIIFSSLFNSAQIIALNGSELVITGNGALGVSGSGAELLTISGNNQSRVFRIEGASVATITDVKITNGKILGNGDGGGILNGGTLIISRSIISNNSGAGEQFFGGGGGIQNNGTLIINSSTISNNSAVSSGGIGNGTGGIGTTATATINNSIVSENSTNGTGGGLYNYFDCTMNINGSVIINNSASVGGGVFSDGRLNLAAVTVENNTARNGGGIGGGGRAVTIVTTSVIKQNSATMSGGGVWTNGDFGSSFAIDNSTVSSNTATQNGGGIFNSRARISITLSTIENNMVSNQGGGIYNDGSFTTMSVASSSINNNTANREGGGTFNIGGSLILNNSTIAGNNSANSVSEGGGGIYSSSELTLTNTTVNGNRTNNLGGGIFNRGTANLIASTVSNNQAVTGGGVFNFDSRMINARNSIIGDNTAGNDSAPDYRGTLNSQGYNLIENTNGLNIAGITTGNITGRDPQLAPLRSNGGATQTVAPLPTSPAVDAADPNGFPAADQRGIARPQDGDLNGAALPDIGAYERQVAAFITTKIADTNDGACNGDCSLREAIAAMSAATAPDKAVVFNPALFNTPRIIVLTGGELAVNGTNGTFSINGPGANLLTFSGNNQSRVFNVAADANISISGVTVTGGNAAGSSGNNGGGGILNRGFLTLLNCIVSNNRAANFGGGGIRNEGVLSIINSTVRNNSATGDGGGIFNFGTGSSVSITNSTINANTSSSGGGIYNFSALTVSNSTVSGNSAVLFGGGVSNDGLFGAVLTVASSTVANNTAGSEGGGIANFSGAVNARNSIIAKNVTGSNTAPDFRGALTSQGYNLLEKISGATISGTTTGNILGQDPLLLPLNNYGGITQTHALRANSPAIDKGGNFGNAADQRGQPRPLDFPNIPNAAGGNGTDIGAFERQTSDAGGTTFFDFDADGKADISVFRPSNGTWYLQQSNNGFTGSQFGISTDKPVAADYDGDGKTDVAVYRDGIWYLNRSSAGFAGIQFGAATDIPQPADYNGDGQADLAVFRPSNGTWYVYNLATNQTSATQFGASGDQPLAADYDGDGRADYAVFRPSNGTWYLNRSALGFVGIAFGEATDKPTPADYDGDSRADIAVFRPSNGTWYLQRSQAGFTGIQFGLGTDVPVPADYDGDGKTDVAVFRNGTWYLQRSTAGFTGAAFGATTDVPVPNVFNP